MITMSEIRQNKSENIEFELDTVGIIIYWKQWGGKTTIALEMAYETWPKRIYSNFSIYLNWKQINKPIKCAKDVTNIRYSKQPWIILIDEAGINANSKDWRSKDNRELIEVLFLVRKYNCSFCWISQRFWSIDVNARELSDLIIKMSKIRRDWMNPIFKATRQKAIWNNVEMQSIHIIDTITLMKYDNLTYNTLETAKFETGEEFRVSRKKTKIKWIEGQINSVKITT